MKILLAIDGSKQSEAAVDEIVSRHFPPGCNVRIISVVEHPILPETFAGGGGNTDLSVVVDSGAEDRARAAVDKASAKLRADEGSRELNITSEVLSGSPKRVILDDAEAFGANLIVVGSHGHGGFERFLLGSVSQAVALHAKCSVEIVR